MKSIIGLFFLASVDAVGNNWFYGSGGGAAGCQNWVTGQRASLGDLNVCSQISDTCTVSPEKTICQVNCWETRCADILTRCNDCTSIGPGNDGICQFFFNETCSVLENSNPSPSGASLYWDNSLNACVCAIPDYSMEFPIAMGNSLYFDNVDITSPFPEADGAYYQVCYDEVEDECDDLARATMRLVIPSNSPNDGYTLLPPELHQIGSGIYGSYGCKCRIKFNALPVPTQRVIVNSRIGGTLAQCKLGWTAACEQTFPQLDDGALVDPEIYAFAGSVIWSGGACQCVQVFNDGTISWSAFAGLDDATAMALDPACKEKFSHACEALSLSIPDTYYNVRVFAQPGYQPAGGYGCYCTIFDDVTDEIVQRHGPLDTSMLQFVPSSVTTDGATVEPTIP